MRKALFALLALGGMAAASSTPAEAWGGCGPNRHPTPYGCRWNGGYRYGGPVFVVGGGYGWRHHGWRGGWGHGGWHGGGHHGWHGGGHGGHHHH